MVFQKDNMEKFDTNPKKRISAHDVASYAGVSQSTVSRVLTNRGSHLISEETRDRVLRAAKQLGYSPDPIASALRGKYTNLIGVIVRDISDPFFANFISVISAKAGAEGYRIILGNAQNDPANAMEMDKVLDTRHCDGVILLGDLQNDEEYLKQLLLGNRPTVAACRGQSPEWIPIVNSDNTTGIHSLVDHLVQLGHRKIAFINGGWLGDMRDRMNAFKDYLSILKIPLPDDCCVSEKNDIFGGYTAMSKLLNCKQIPTAVCAADDILAVGALRAIQDAGLRVPQDISLTGFDDIEFSRFTNPRLTSIKQDVEKLSNEVLTILIDLIKQKEIDSNRKSILVKTELIIRDSTGQASSKS